MSKHTPGPWKAIDDWLASSTSKIAVVVEREPGIEKLLCHFSHGAFPEDDAANAKLIAAAPKMYELLKDFVDRGPDPGAFLDSAVTLLMEVDNE